MRYLRRIAAAMFLSAAMAGAATPAAAYSVLSHEATVDSAWDSVIVPLLKEKYPGLSAEDLRRARAHAYGGALIQDLGYYPFGSRFFSNLVHYVRSGDFVKALFANAHDPDEYAFALGALAHYSSDNTGHPIAVNRSVPILYPKLQAKFGDEVIYAQSPAQHLMVEFAFDVTQVAKGGYVAQAYRDLIGFEVAKPLLERAFHDTYGIELKSVFLDEDLAIGTFRYAVSHTIPEMTRIAWRDKRKEILARTPGVQENAFVFSLSRRQYNADYGTKYRQPGLLSRALMLVLKVLPKVGPLRPLAFKPLTPETEKLFVESFAAAGERYRTALRSLRAGSLSLSDTDLDTGQAPARGRNPLADETYVELLEALTGHKSAAPPAALRADIVAHYRAGPVGEPDRKARKRDEKARKLLAELPQVAAATR